MRRRDLLRLMGLGGLYGLALITRPAEAHRTDSSLTPTAGRQVVRVPAPTFTLADQDGNRFAFQSWRGRAVVVTFGFTSCSDVCPLLGANLAVIQAGLADEDRARTGFLFITTDPEYDRPAVLREYGIKLGADFSHWKLLTGDLEALRPVWGGFGVSVRKLGPGQVDHTTLTTVVDRGGIRRVNYYGTRWRPETTMDDMLAWAHEEARKL